MNTLNAVGFLICGIGMILAPWVATNLFPPDLLTGGTSGLWVEFMGWVNGLTGGGYLVASRLAALARRSLAWPPAQPEETAATGVLRPAFVLAPVAKMSSERREAA